MVILLKSTKGLELLEGEFTLVKRKDGLYGLEIFREVEEVFRTGYSLDLIGFEDAYGNIHYEELNYKGLQCLSYQE